MNLQRRTRAQHVLLAFSLVAALAPNGLRAQERSTLGLAVAGGVTAGELGPGTASGSVSFRTTAGWDLSLGVVSYIQGYWRPHFDIAPTLQLRTPLLFDDHVYFVVAPRLHWNAHYRAFSAGIGHPVHRCGLALEAMVQHGSQVNAFELTMRKRW